MNEWESVTGGVEDGVVRLDVRTASGLRLGYSVALDRRSERFFGVVVDRMAWEIESHASKHAEVIV